MLDFEQPRERVRALPSVAAVRLQVDGHIVIPAVATQAGENAIRIEFLPETSRSTATTTSCTRSSCRPVRGAFPCFDQPDLKARYSLSLDVPAGWQAVANGRADGDRRRPAQVAHPVRPDEPLPTYLFAFAAGKFRWRPRANGRTVRMFHRETDAAKVARNRDAIFDLHAAALAWLEDYTAIPYPFGKFDFVAHSVLPVRGMEHAGRHLLQRRQPDARRSATQNQLLGRASLIAHETAHMWFGDLVTMRWFNDVWMKEVFANFMAAKIVNPSFPELNHELRFLLAHYPAAYEVDRTAGTNPIRQALANLNEAGQIYGPIIYHKAPIVMRQLE